MNQFKSILFFTLIALGIINTSKAQLALQTFRGNVVDKVSQQSIPGATIVILNTSPVLASVANTEGQFKIPNVPIGKYSVQISFLGYKPVTLQNITINAGKELVLNINMEEDITALSAVEVVAKVEKNKAQNSMSTVSTRTFSVEETQKFAAAVNDPARMATSFAGVVSAAGDGNNLISIRGNSPSGLLWRMEGVEIPNPNHFSSVGASGGGISILSAQLLSNSDFSTGAFAAEYGNALSGVFDLKLRKGNNERREYTFQAGFLGIDASTEGYFKKGYQGSYLINYRYSTLGLIGKLGVNIGDAKTIFQDVSFNVSLPTRRIGNFTLFGFGGLSQQSFDGKRDSMKWKEDNGTQYNFNFIANTGAIGITHTKLFANQSYLKTAIVYSGTQNNFDLAKLNLDYVARIQDRERFLQAKTTLSSVYTQKINARSSFRTGFIFNLLNYNLNKKNNRDTNVLVERINTNGNTEQVQAFFQWNYKLRDKWTTNIGLHYNQLFLNSSKSLEPRASLKYDLTEKQNFTFGYGLHSQIQPIGIYFTRSADADGNSRLINSKLEFSKAHHLVFGYDLNLNAFSHIKTEVYYQYLFDIPISQKVNSTFSILNTQDGFTSEPFVNNGLGKNYGLELTYERFMHKNLYYLLSASLYDSKYQAQDGKWYNTLYNANYATTFTMGKEWTLSEKRKSRVIGFNIKSVLIGGSRYTPIDLEASIKNGEARYNQAETFTQKNPDYYRLDLRLSSKRNYKKITTTLAIDIQNVTNRKNVGGQYFDPIALKIKYFYQAPLIPILSYKLEF